MPGSQDCVLLPSYQMPAPLETDRSGPKVTTVIGALTNYGVLSLEPSLEETTGILLLCVTNCDPPHMESTVYSLLPMDNGNENLFDFSP